MAKMYITPEGNQIAAKYVSIIDKKKDRICNKYLNKFQRISNQMKAIKSAMLKETDELYNKMLNDENVRTGKKGNYSITSFDKAIKIEVNIQNKIVFDDQINVAQTLINEFIAEKTKGTDQELAELINSAFQTTRGRLDTKRILGLFKLQIKHKKWLQAMELIKRSISTNNSKRYVRIWHKDVNGEYQNVELNFSSI